MLRTARWALLVLLAALTGEVAAGRSWEYTTASEIFGPRAIGDDVVFVESGEAGTRIVRLNAGTGRPVWSYAIEPGRRLLRLPTVDGQKIYLYSAAIENERDDGSAIETRLVTLDGGSGQVASSLSLPTRDLVVHSPFVANGRLYFATVPRDDNFYEPSRRPPGSFVACELASGRIVWKTALPLRQARATDLQNLTLGSRSVNPWIARPTEMTADESRLYLGYPNGRLFGLDLRTGAIAWQFRTRDRFLVSPVLQDGVLYFGSQDWNFYAVRAATGTLAWSAATGADVGHSAPLFDRDQIIVSSGEYQLLPISSIVMFSNPDANDYADHSTNSILALDLVSGNIRWRHDGASVSYGPLLRNQRVVIFDARGLRTELDPDRGTVLREQALNMLLRGVTPVTGNRLVLQTSNIAFFRRGTHFRDLVTDGDIRDRLLGSDE